VNHASAPPVTGSLIRRISSHGTVHVAALTALCLVTYCAGLTTHGLTTWQEAQRALVAREMQSRGEWLLPTVDGRPYLAKPPMMYWWQLTLASLRGSLTGEFELRLTVALAGWLGVVATYFAGRVLMAQPPPLGAPEVQADPGLGALWAALMLATGLLYVRSSRIGELDILLVPFTVLCIGAVAHAWRTHLLRGRTGFGAVGLAVLGGTGAALTKGPPAVLVIALPYLGMLAWHLADRGVPLGSRLGRTLRSYSRTHPVAVLGLPLAAYFGWLYLAAQRAPGVASAAFEAERSDNLRLFVAEAPINNLSAASYGVGLGSLACLGALVWIVRRRVRPGPMLAVLLAWVIGGMVAFSVLGKGVPRYLTPLWPGIALLGGLWWTRTLPLLPAWKLLRGTALLAILVMAGLQAWWYGFGREAQNPERSPRAMLRELLSRPGAQASRLVMFEFDTPAVDYYAGQRVDSYRDGTPRPGLVGVGNGTILYLKAMAAQEPVVALVRRTQPPSMDPALAADRLREAGLTLEPIPLSARFVIDNKRSEVVAVRLIAR
jgi:4-amino-4-deoxy-L-arabinose transferase-like glycosyltransferase